MMRTGFVVVLGTMLAGCGSNSTSTGNKTTTTTTPDPMEAKIDALNEGQRKTAFFRAIYDADYQCDEITQIADRPRNNDRRAWMVTCSDAGEYYITLQPGGIFTVSGIPQAKTRLPKGTKILPPETK